MARKKEFVSQEYSTQTHGKNLKEGTRESRAAAVFSTLFFSLAAMSGVVMIAFSIVCFYSTVIGPSMMTTINAAYREVGDTDSVIVNRFKKPERGDIIVVDHYENGVKKELHIKRILAFGDETVRFALSPDETRYIIYINDGSGEINYDALGIYPFAENNSLSTEYGMNMRNTRYDNFYKYQQGTLSPGLTGDGESDFSSFKQTYIDENGEERQFRRQNTETGLWEIYIPHGYMFYMGDNRGGKGGDLKPSNYDVRYMSVDCTYYGPQPYSHLVGTVTEVIYNKNAPQWFLEKLVWIFTFKWI